MLSFFWWYKFFLGIYLSCLIFSVSFLTVAELLCGEIIEIIAILSAILFPIKSLTVSTVWWIALFETVLSASVADI